MPGKSVQTGVWRGVRAEGPVPGAPRLPGVLFCEVCATGVVGVVLTLGRPSCSTDLALLSSVLINYHNKFGVKSHLH